MLTVVQQLSDAVRTSGSLILLTFCLMFTKCLQAPCPCSRWEEGRKVCASLFCLSEKVLKEIVLAERKIKALGKV